jgi:hypothetical protein
MFGAAGLQVEILELGSWMRCGAGQKLKTARVGTSRTSKGLANLSSLETEREYKLSPLNYPHNSRILGIQ